MRTFLIVIFIIALTAMAQDADSEAAVFDSSASDFESLEPFVRGLAMSSREVTVYRVRANSLPSYKHSNPIVIVWTRDGLLTERKDGEASATRKVSAGQIDVYAGGTTRSLRAVKGSIHFTLIELKQGLRSTKEMPNKPVDCKSAVDFPQGGFACLIQLEHNEEITIPKLDVNSVLIALGSGKVCYTIPRLRWESQTREGRPIIFPGYEEHGLQNLERKPSQFALIVPPPAEYN
jgi:hypothetical protein